jgi:opacity protein-like surface antigen
MNKRSLGLCLVLFSCACAAARAQQPPSPPAADNSNSAGLIGKDYFSASLFGESFRNSTLTHGYGTNLGLNLPAADNFDVALDYQFERVPKTPQLTDNSLQTSFIGYLAAGGVKPFMDADVGYLWQKSKGDGTKTLDNRGTCAAGAGLEVPVMSSTALTGRAAINDEFKRGSRHTWAYTAGVNQSITDSMDAVLHVTFNEGNSTVYNLGVAFIF